MIYLAGPFGFWPRKTPTRPRRWPTWRRSSELNTRPTNQTRPREGATCALVGQTSESLPVQCELAALQLLEAGSGTCVRQPHVSQELEQTSSHIRQEF